MHTQIFVIELPIRDGNVFGNMVDIGKDIVIELPIRDGNDAALPGWRQEAEQVIELPIRDGNKI